MTITTTLISRDQKTLWHPFTQHGLESEFFPVVKAKGAWLELADGRKILDAISSWWVNLHGHAHQYIADAIYAQAQQMEHTVFASFTHEPAIKLAEILLAAVQARGTSLSRCFYSDNGSTAVEVAMKMAYQYHKNQGIKTRTRFLALHNSYHGDTLGCMALSARDSFHSHFLELLPTVDFVLADDIADLEHCLAQHPDQYAALIIEPMIQGAGGMKIHSAEFLAAVATHCKKNQILLICDEVFTAFYRTGLCFAFEHAALQPDLLCLSKGITGGFLPLGAVLATEEIFLAYQSSEFNYAFLHGHSYTANPLACAAAIASWHILQQAETQENIKKITKKTQLLVSALSQHENCQAARSLGTIGVIEKRGLSSNYILSKIAHKIRAFAIQHGVLIRPLGSVLSTVPAYCMLESELEQIYKVIELILNEREF